MFVFMSALRKMLGEKNNTAEFGDTTYTKIFVGGLAWETKSDSLKRYFQQFGEILEAVVIADKSSGRSKGYGFVNPFLVSPEQLQFSFSCLVIFIFDLISGILGNV